MSVDQIKILALSFALSACATSSMSSKNKKEVEAQKRVLQQEFFQFSSCSSYATQDSCRNSGCVWDKSCIGGMFSKCGEASNQNSCTDLGCSWSPKAGCVATLFSCPALNTTQSAPGAAIDTDSQKFSELYLHFLEHADDHSDIEKARSYHLLLVPGLFSELYGSLRNGLATLSPTGKFEFLNSWENQKTFFEHEGIPFHFAPIHSQQSCAFNAQILADEIQKIPQDAKIILIGHSKGGVDILNALVRFPKIRPRIQGWIAIQAPFLGTPLVEPASLRGINYVMASVMGVLNGSHEALACLARDASAEFNHTNATELAAIQRIPTVQYGSWIPNTDSGSSLAMTNLYICSQGEGENDGMVPLSSACLPGARCIHGNNIDHAGPVMDLPLFTNMGEPARLALTRALLSTLISSLESQ